MVELFSLDHRDRGIYLSNQVLDPFTCPKYLPEPQYLPCALKHRPSTNRASLQKQSVGPLDYIARISILSRLTFSRFWWISLSINLTCRFASAPVLFWDGVHDRGNMIPAAPPGGLFYRKVSIEITTDIKYGGEG